MGGEGFKQRGIIPRTLSAVFNEIQARTEWSCRVDISFLEIYNERLFDLLGSGNADSDLAVQEDAKGFVCHTSKAQ